MIRGNPRKSVAKNSSDVQVLHVERVLLDELARRFNGLDHERGEDGLAFGDIFQLHRKQRAALAIHRRFPKLRSCHLAQTFVALDSELLPPFVDDVITKLADVGLFYDLDVFALGSLGSGLLLRFVFHRRRLAVHSVAICGSGSSLNNALDHKRRLHVRLDLLVLGDHLAALRAGNQLPVDDVLSAVLVDEAQFPKVVFFVELRLDGLEAFVFLQLLDFFFQLLDFLRRIFLFAFEIGSFGKIESRNQLGDMLVAQPLIGLFKEPEILVEHGHKPRQVFALELGCAFAVTEDQSISRALYHHLHELALVFDVLLRLALLQREQRRLRDEDVAALDQFLHVAKEKRQQERADVAAVDVGVGHQDDFAVAHLRRSEIVLGNAGAERGDHGADFFVRQHLVVARLLDIQNLSLERKNCLKTAITSLLRGSTCGLALDQEQLAAVRIALGTVRQLAGQSSGVQCPLTASQVARFACSFTRTGGVNGFVNDLLRDRRILLEECSQSLVDELGDGSGNIGIQLAFGLAFELRLRQLHADNRNQSFPNVISGQGLFDVFQKPQLLPGIIAGASESRAES